MGFEDLTKTSNMYDKFLFLRNIMYGEIGFYWFE